MRINISCRDSTYLSSLYRPPISNPAASAAALLLSLTHLVVAIIILQSHLCMHTNPIPVAEISNRRRTYANYIQGNWKVPRHYSQPATHVHFDRPTHRQ